MTRTQIIVIAAFFIALFGIYFGLDHRPPKVEEMNRSRSLVSESTDISIVIKEAVAEIDETAQDELHYLEKVLENATEDSIRVEALKQIAGKWYDLGHPAISGYFAERVADIRNDETAWSIAGTTYSLCVKKSKEEKLKDFCSKRSVGAFENAISLNPDNTSHRVNLALTYTTYPPKDNPMKGILMLVDLNKKYPEDVTIMAQLGRLAIQTGQYDKAIQRLSRAIELQPDYRQAHCLIADAFSQKGNNEKSTFHAAICQENAR